MHCCPESTESVRTRDRCPSTHAPLSILQAATATLPPSTWAWTTLTRPTPRHSRGTQHTCRRAVQVRRAGVTRGGEPTGTGSTLCLASHPRPLAFPLALAVNPAARPMSPQDDGTGQRGALSCAALPPTSCASAGRRCNGGRPLPDLNCQRRPPLPSCSPPCRKLRRASNGLRRPAQAAQVLEEPALAQRGSRRQRSAAVGSGGGAAIA